MVAVPDKSVPQGILGNAGRRLGTQFFSQQEVDGLLQQDVRRDLPDDPIQQCCGGQDAHL